MIPPREDTSAAVVRPWSADDARALTDAVIAARALALACGPAEQLRAWSRLGDAMEQIGGALAPEDALVLVRALTMSERGGRA